VVLFTVDFELGAKTRETLRQIANTSVLRFELGPETRALIEGLPRHAKAPSSLEPAKAPSGGSLRKAPWSSDQSRRARARRVGRLRTLTYKRPVT